ncbi:asparagine synthase (glutamine-hydrolyzing) [Candidatus Pseudothioglobus singularis]|jgi:asparagine synthase (glutamine-hydrolysing)|nr:asparagine synthase (glutamine-hydrolyzing) [Candidatus Pseudothioglobus singularis]
MCGFSGFIGYSSYRKNTLDSVSYKMGEAISHRGPDDSGVWYDSKAELTLIHRRLSILDLTSAGHQPMISSSGRYVISFNGEIYNHNDLRLKLQGKIRWKGSSDTETLLAMIEIKGLSETLEQIVGMFAFALWDKKEKSLYLARDRLGEKPLYYGWQKDVFLFGSEIKSLKAHPSFEGEIDRDSIALQLRHSCIPAPYSIFKGIKKLLPGTFLKFSNKDYDLNNKNLPEPKQYWSMCDIAKRGSNHPFKGSESSAIEELDRLLSHSVREQMIADVPLGAFLSGGVDSSTIVALMQKQSSDPIKTFSIGFNERGYDEAKYAKDVARHLGTQHTELYVTAKEAISLIDYLPQLYDEPFSDSSQIPTFLVSSMTQKNVKVSLSGDGGDELFGGYNRYFKTYQWWDKINITPILLRKILSKGMLKVPPRYWDLVGNIFEGISGNNISKIAKVISLSDEASLYKYFISNWDDPASVVIGSNEPRTQIYDTKINLNSIVEEMMLMDALTYLPDDILTKVDRAAMGVSLETRIPMLDHRVIEFAWQLPLSMKIRNGQGKWILRQLLNQYVPNELIERPKMGFGVPIDSWLRGPLRDWAECLLSDSRLRSEGYFNSKLIREKWCQHLSGDRNWQHHLWDILMFQAWLEEQS